MSLQKLSFKNGKRIAFVKKTMAAIVLGGFAWLIFSAVSSNVETENLEPQIIKAPQGIKSRPISPGGMKIEHQDKQVFDLLESDTSGGEAKFVVAESQHSEQRVADLAQQAVKKAEIAKTVKVVKTQAPKLVKPIAKPTVKTVAPVVKVEKIVKKQESKMAIAKKIEPKTTVVSSTEVKNVKGWVVQLGSFKKTEDAKRAVKIYNKKVGTILKGLNPYIKKADLGNKGVVYRVYFTGFKDKTHAQNICNELQAKKQACFRTILK